MTGDTFGNIDLSALYALFVDLAANLYSRALSPYASRVTHASFDAEPHLFFDYYRDYNETGVLCDYAQRLIDSFVMDIRGYDDEEHHSLHH